MPHSQQTAHTHTNTEHSNTTQTLHYTNTTLLLSPRWVEPQEPLVDDVDDGERLVDLPIVDVALAQPRARERLFVSRVWRLLWLLLLMEAMRLAGVAA